MFVWRELWFAGAGVSIFEENIFNVPIHGYAAGLIGVPVILIPCNVYSCDFPPFPVSGDIVVLLHSMEEM